jgi:hypothetical protein
MKQGYLEMNNNYVNLHTSEPFSPDTTKAQKKCWENIPPL